MTDNRKNEHVQSKTRFKANTSSPSDNFCDRNFYESRTSQQSSKNSQYLDKIGIRNSSHLSKHLLFNSLNSKNVSLSRLEVNGIKALGCHECLKNVDKINAQSNWRGESSEEIPENERLQIDTSKFASSSCLESPRSRSKSFVYDLKEAGTEQFRFELKRKDKTIEVLKNEVFKKTEALRELRKEIDELKAYKLNVELSNESSRSLQESRVTAKIALNAAELDSLRDRNERLEYRFSEMEELLKQKDTELQTLQQQTREREEECSKLSRELHASQYELSLRNASLVEYRLERNNLDENQEKKLHELEENTQQHLRQLKIQHKYETAKLVDQINEVERKQMLSEKKILELTQQLLDYELILQKANNDKEELCERFIELEAELSATMNQKVELLDMLEREKQYQKEIERLQTMLHCFDKDNMILKSIQNDNVSLTHEIIRLKQQLARQSAKSTVDSSSNLASSNLPTATCFPKPIELRQVLTSSTDQQGLPSASSTRREHWSNMDKWRLDF